MPDDRPPIGQEHLDIVAIQSFHEAIWDHARRFPCGICRIGDHQNCQRWYRVRVPELRLGPISFPAEPIKVREELHLCGCTCPVAKRLQWLKGEPEAAR